MNRTSICTPPNRASTHACAERR
uniref:Uncharacterized protein n=1 Tax=Rhizophora mucronata TaxID=61149 RepID=A0A2P2QJK6_RHIMU